jgi:hypothetical protein
MRSALGGITPPAPSAPYLKIKNKKTEQIDNLNQKKKLKRN